MYGCCGLREVPVHVARLDELPGVHHDHPVAQLRHHAQIVRDVEDRGAQLVAQAADQVDDLRLERDVQRRGRLVGNQQRRAATAGAMAIMMRWRMPPENWCG